MADKNADGVSREQIDWDTIEALSKLSVVGC